MLTYTFAVHVLPCVAHSGSAPKRRLWSEEAMRSAVTACANGTTLRDSAHKYMFSEFSTPSGPISD